MDALSPLSDFPSMTSPGSKETKQPVYTTAGTLFDPTTTTPIQPPARRGRTLRFPSPAQPGFGLLGTDATKSGFPVFGRRTRSPTRSEKAQQYSPLQQNYDRAISPSLAGNLHRASSDMAGLAVPTIRSGNVPAPPGLPRGLDKQGLTASFTDAESDSSQEALVAQFKVKTLKSLASYPNQWQKAAKSVLEKARHPIAAATAQDLARVGTPSSLSYASSDLTRDATALPLQLRATQSDIALGKMPYIGTYAAVESDRTYQHNAGVQETSYRPGSSGLNGQERLARYTPLASGPSVPRPLTAGPPGQRQYRPSTLEPMMKAFQAASPKPHDHSSLPLRPSDAVSGRQGLQHNPSAEVTNGRVLPFMRGTATEPRQPTSELQRHRVVEHDLNDQQSRRVGVQDTLSPEALRQYFPLGLPADYIGPAKSIAFNWADSLPLHRETAKALSPEELAARNVKINNEWYAGTELLGKTLRDVQYDADRQAFKVTVGTIGEERQRAHTRRASQIGNFGRTFYPPMSIEKANTMDDCRHAEPLLLMAYASLLSYVTDNTKADMSGFRLVEEWLIDPTETGRQSYFEQKKERRVRKRTRKGY